MSKSRAIVNKILTEMEALGATKATEVVLATKPTLGEQNAC